MGAGRATRRPQRLAALAIPEFIKLAGDLVQSVLPLDPLPPALASLADPLHGIVDAARMVEVLE
jgi:hypothetical protein